MAQNKIRDSDFLRHLYHLTGIRCKAVIGDFVCIFCYFLHHPVLLYSYHRQLIAPPLSSKSMRPPRSTFLAVESSSQEFGKLNRSQSKFKKHINAQEDEMSENLQPIMGDVQSDSPNSKRASPLHGKAGFTPGLRSSRKLILQSIPSFPSLTPKH